MARVETVLITGASSGIGLELAHVWAREGYNVVGIGLDKVGLEAAMQGIAHEYGVRAWPLHVDLTKDTALAKIDDFLQDERIIVDTLINNAGFGVYGSFLKTEWDDERDLIRLNIERLTELTKFFAMQMKRRGHGTIVNVASIAAYFPGVYMDTYYASKSYVLSFTLAVREELHAKGVQVHCLCPGPTKSGFQSRAQADRSRLFGRAGSARKVADAAWRGVAKGKPIIIPGWRNKTNVFLSRFVPQARLARLVRKAD